MSKQYKPNQTTQKVMNVKEQWAEDVIESVSEIKRAKPSNDLFDQILMDISKQESALIGLQSICWTALVASLVIGFNVYVLTLNKQTVVQGSVQVDQTISIQSDFTIYTE